MYESNAASECLEDKDTTKLTLFFDGHCPLCSAEMRQLSELDVGKRLILVDLHQADFDQQYPHIDKVQANKILQAQQKKWIHALWTRCELQSLGACRKKTLATYSPLAFHSRSSRYRLPNFCKKSFLDILYFDWEASL